MRRARLFSLKLLFAGLTPLPLLAQDTGAAKQHEGKSNMSMHDMMGHMSGCRITRPVIGAVSSPEASEVDSRRTYLRDPAGERKQTSPRFRVVRRVPIPLAARHQAGLTLHSKYENSSPQADASKQRSNRSEPVRRRLFRLETLRAYAGSCPKSSTLSSGRARSGCSLYAAHSSKSE